MSLNRISTTFSLAKLIFFYYNIVESSQGKMGRGSERRDPI
ncbi:hypothetical protein HMPREF9555_01359 [Selenomonas artemidis F0399]|uniref:Uncharacterized protein n=1 Tax=Selenomonas artemidis F0399 TaxID=749551 RepID=E7N2Y8_9FIRM|nr:hypothetical protein HMPREF9555_01359 [Selenomonas artemidis F0399]